MGLRGAPPWLNDRTITNGRHMSLSIFCFLVGGCYEGSSLRRKWCCTGVEKDGWFVVTANSRATSGYKTQRAGAHICPVSIREPLLSWGFGDGGSDPKTTAVSEPP